MNENQIAEFMRKLSKLMTVSFVIWIVICVYQLILGLCSAVVGYGFATLGIMVWNLIGCIRYYKVIQIIKNYRTKEEAADAVAYFENSLVACWIFMFINLIFGGCLGFVGNLYDLILSYYVKGQKAELLRPVDSEQTVYEQV